MGNIGRISKKQYQIIFKNIAKQLIEKWKYGRDENLKRQTLEVAQNDQKVLKSKVQKIWTNSENKTQQFNIFFHLSNLRKHPMNEFQVIKELGSGSFGRVLKVRRRQDGNIFAMKTIKMMSLSAKEKDNALNEVRLLASIDSPNVIKYKGAFFQQCGNILSIVMEFADGGDLAGLIEKKITKNQRFDENFVWKVAFDILKGLKFLHNSNIIHRDIKSANIFFVNGIAKLGDLNVSKVMEGNFATTQTGTPYYTSPQIWQGKKYNSTCDIWSLGCLLYELCALKPPFTAKDFPGLMKKVTAGYYEPIPSKYSKKLSTLIKKCLTLDYSKRPSANELLQTDVFTIMEAPQQGEIQLLDTIRCPRVLKLLNKQLPQDQYETKPKTLKIILDESTDTQNSSKVYPRSLKRIDSEKVIRPMSIQRPAAGMYKIPQYGSPVNQNKPMIPSNPSNKLIQAQNQVMGSPNGYLKLPRVVSHKAIHY